MVGLDHPAPALPHSTTRRPRPLRLSVPSLAVQFPLAAKVDIHSTRRSLTWMRFTYSRGRPGRWLHSRRVCSRCSTSRRPSLPTLRLAQSRQSEAQSSPTVDAYLATLDGGSQPPATSSPVRQLPALEGPKVPLPPPCGTLTRPFWSLAPRRSRLHWKHSSVSPHRKPHSSTLNSQSSSSPLFLKEGPHAGLTQRQDAAISSKRSLNWVGKGRWRDPSQ